MKYTNIIDMHTHSDNSFDGNHSCVMMCEGAIKKESMGIAITDHCEIDAKNFDFRAFTTNQFVETFMAKQSFEGKLLVLQGLEIGQAIYNKQLSEQILNDFKYDFVLGSIHNLENMEDFYYLNYKNYDIDKLLTQYFENELKLCQWNKFDSLAHLTYPLRYIVAREHIDVDITKYYNIIDEIFATLIKNDKALELNTSGLFMDIEDTLPNKELIKRFHDMGGKYVTIGSDSHYYDRVCQGIETGMDILKECGYDSFTIFENRQPLTITIE